MFNGILPIAGNDLSHNIPALLAGNKLGHIAEIQETGLHRIKGNRRYSYVSFHQVIKIGLAKLSYFVRIFKAEFGCTSLMISLMLHIIPNIPGRIRVSAIKGFKA